MTTQSLQYSYSGADCDVFAIRGSETKQLKSVATVSVSVYDAKAPVRALGHRSVKGYTGSIRTVAGSIVFVVVEGHPLEELMDKNSGRYHLDNNDLQVSNLPNKVKRNTYPIGSISPFKLMLMYKNEIGNSAGLEIDNIEFVSEGIVTSVNDMVTEVVVQFVASDFRQLTRAKQMENDSINIDSTEDEKKIETVQKLIASITDATDDLWNVKLKALSENNKELLTIYNTIIKVYNEEEWHQNNVKEGLDQLDRLMKKENALKRFNEDKGQSFLKKQLLYDLIYREIKKQPIQTKYTPETQEKLNNQKTKKDIFLDSLNRK